MKYLPKIGLRCLGADLLTLHTGFLRFLPGLPWARRTRETNEEMVERPAFSTNIFDESEESTADDNGQDSDHQMFWFCVVIALFFVGVVVSYCIIHYFE